MKLIDMIGFFNASINHINKEEDVKDIDLLKVSKDSIKEKNTGKESSVSFYNPDVNQTDENPTEGSFGREMEWGDVGVGNRKQENKAKEKYRKKNLNSFIFIPELENIETPYGNGIFRINDTMNERYAKTNNIDIFVPDDKKDKLSKEIDIGRIKGRYGFINETHIKTK